MYLAVQKARQQRETGSPYAAAWWAVRAPAAMVQAQNLLPGQGFSVGRYLGALFGAS